MSDSEIWDERIAPRQEISTAVDFTIEANEFTARSLDISLTGMRIQSAAPLPFIVKIKMADEVQERRATLVWAKTSEDGIMNYGLQFLDDDQEL